MDNFLIDLIIDYGYIGMFLAMVLESIIIIIPSELILATGGILAGRGILTLGGAFLAGLIGSVTCAAIIYAMGYYGGRPFIEKYGKYFFMKQEDIAKSEVWLRKYGLIAAFLGRNFPIVRTMISLPIGMARLNFFKFILYSTLGSIPWTFAFVWAGYALGGNWIVVEQITERLKVPIIVLICLLIAMFLWHIVNKSKANQVIVS